MEMLLKFIGLTSNVALCCTFYCNLQPIPDSKSNSVVPQFTDNYQVLNIYLPIPSLLHIAVFISNLDNNILTDIRYLEAPPVPRALHRFP